MLNQLTCVLYIGEKDMDIFPWDDLPAVLREVILANVPLVRLAQIAHPSTELEIALRKIDRYITSFQPPRLIRWCTCTSKPFACKRQAAHFTTTAALVGESSDCPAFRDEIGALLEEARMRGRPRHGPIEGVSCGGDAHVPEAGVEPELPPARTRAAFRHWLTREVTTCHIPSFTRVQCFSTFSCGSSPPPYPKPRLLYYNGFMCTGQEPNAPKLVHAREVSFEVVEAPWRRVVRCSELVIWCHPDALEDPLLATCLKHCTAFAACVRQLLHEYATREACREVPGNRRTRRGNVGAVESIKLVLPMAMVCPMKHKRPPSARPCPAFRC
jgi:hypothetical protein